jgi:hypothetical protein
MCWPRRVLRHVCRRAARRQPSLQQHWRKHWRKHWLRHVLRPAVPPPAVRHAARLPAWRPCARRRPVQRRPPLSRLDGLPALPPPSRPASLRHAGRRARPVFGLPAWQHAARRSLAWQPGVRQQPVLRPAQPLSWRPCARWHAFLQAGPPSRQRPVQQPRVWRRPVRIADRPAAPWPA